MKTATAQQAKPEKKRKIPVFKINPKLAPFILPIEIIKPDPKNARVHDEESLTAIRNSLDKFSQQTPIVITEKRVVHKGNGTLEAAKQLGWTHIAAVVTDLKKREDLVGYKTADNKTGELSKWNWKQLAADIKEFPDFDWKGLGWKQWELEPILGAEWTPAKKDDSVGSEGAGHTSVVKFTTDQMVTIDRAVAACRLNLRDGEASEGKCLEVICLEYLDRASDSH